MSKAKNIHTIEIKIEKEEWGKYLDRAFNKVKNKVSIDGFRKGKITREIFNKKVGTPALYEDALNFAIDSEYKKLMEDDKYKPIVQPTVDFKDINEDGVTLIFTITEFPEIELCDYKNLKAKKEKVEITDKELEDEINHLREDFAEIVIKDDKESAKLNDIVIIDFEGFIDNKAFEGGKAENYQLELGSNTFIPGFEEQIVGMKKGEEKDINVVFPEDYHKEDLKNKPAVFKVKVHEIKEKQLPEINQEFFEDLGYTDIKTEEEFKNIIKDELKQRKEVSVEDKYINDIFDELVKECKFEGLPEELINEEKERMYKQFEQNVKQYGMIMDNYLKIIKKSKEEFMETFTEEATFRVKTRLILEKIIEVEKIEVTDEDIKNRIDEIAKRNNMSDEDKEDLYAQKDIMEYDTKITKVVNIIKGE